ncbi:sigma factor-like helix-turn-helix DNA-binding protein [Actinoplanes sp. NPDC051411]|uniref:sigma factor-like helix-turn-helix DNA-binding protein n=1 Tax=Actinoplanes sp. NPDC051411 TaxID=3155522 RepID=UPI00343B971A
MLWVPPRHAIATPRRRRRHRAKPGAERDILRYPIEAILHALPPAHREILVATYFRRQTTRQAAQQLNITDEDARRRVYHATRELTAAVVAARLSRPDELPPTNPDRWRRGALSRRS